MTSPRSTGRWFAPLRKNNRDLIHCFGGFSGQLRVVSEAKVESAAKGFAG